MIDYVRDTGKNIMYNAEGEEQIFKSLPIWGENCITVGARFYGYSDGGSIFVLVKVADGRILLADAPLAYAVDHSDTTEATPPAEDEPISDEAISQIQSSFQAMFA